MNCIDSKQVKYLIENSEEPIVFKNYINHWKIGQWTLHDWENKLGNTKLQFRKYHFIKSTSPIWEQTCTLINITMKEFNKFQNLENSEFWLYFDYKYMEEWFQNYTDILKDITWGNFGYPEKSGKDSTIWIGSKGAHTPCHMDTYGCNLIAQVYGRKKWIIFPPAEDLKPTRVPYEESSVYSKLNFFSPNVHDFRGINNARTVILNPGEVLFLPVGWWHYVENIETAISVNIWIPQVQDDKKRVEEAITQTIVSQLTNFLDTKDRRMILNPNSMEVADMSLSNSLNILDQVIEICKAQKTIQKEKTDIHLSPTNIKNILKENESVEIVRRLSEEEFLTLLQEQETNYFNCSEVKSNVQKSNNVTIIEKIINAVCHPQTLNLIREKLLND